MRNQETKPFLSFEPSTFETIDGAVLDWVKQLNIHSTYVDGFRPVPVLWATTERSFQVKNLPEIRDKSQRLIFPLISIERASIEKSLGKKGAFFGNVPSSKLDAQGGSINVVRRIQQNKTQNFANRKAVNRNKQITFRLEPKNKKVVYEHLSLPMPVHYETRYNIYIDTDYETQMNEIVQPFMVYSGNINYFVVSKNGHKFDAFIDGDFQRANNTDNIENEPRKFRTIIPLRILGYIQGSDKNQSRPKIAIRENPVEWVFPPEREFFTNQEQNKKNNYQIIIETSGS